MNNKQQKEGTYFYRMALHLLKHVGISEAIEAFTTSIALTSDALSFCYTGYAYFNLYQYEKADADYTKAIELDDISVPEVYFFRGTLNGLLKEYGNAIQDLTKAIELEDEGWLADAYYYRGASFGAVGEYDMAIDDMRMAARAGHGPAKEFLKKRGLGW